VSSYPKRGLHGRVVQVVGQRIAQGVLAPDDAIDVEALGCEFGVSRTVVRESLKVLAAKGLVDARPKRGTFVRPRSDWSLLDPDLLRWRFAGPPDARFLHDLAELRQIIEPAAARLAAGRRTPEQLATLERAVAAMERAAAATPAAREATTAVISFHGTLLRAAGNELLERMEAVIEAGLRGAHHQLHESDHWAATTRAHRAVLAGIRAGDPDAADQAMAALLRQVAADTAAALARAS